MPLPIWEGARKEAEGGGKKKETQGKTANLMYSEWKMGKVPYHKECIIYGCFWGGDFLQPDVEEREKENNEALTLWRLWLQLSSSPPVEKRLLGIR